MSHWGSGRELFETVYMLCYFVLCCYFVLSVCVVCRLEKLINNLKDEVVETEKQAELFKAESGQKEMQLGDLHKKMLQQEQRLKNSMNMFVNMRDDRDYYSHSSFQLQTEIKTRDAKIEGTHLLHIYYTLLYITHLL